MKMRDLAEGLGLSLSTVSRALRNAEGVDVETRSRVLAEAARGGYRRGVGKWNRAGNPKTMLVLSRGDVASVPWAALSGMSVAAIELNVSILTHQIPADELEGILVPRSQPPALRAGQVDGIILHQEWPVGLVAEMRQIRPVVSLLHGYEGVDTVGIDLEEGMRCLAGHLHGAIGGHLGLYFKSGESGFSRRLERSFEGACADLGVTGEMVRTASAAGAALSNGLRGWVCADGWAARELLSVANEAGLEVPRDLVIAVFLPVTDGLGDSIRWTCLGLRGEDLGVAAVRRLLRRIESPGESVRSVLLQVGLRQGETTPPFSVKSEC